MDTGTSSYIESIRQSNCREIVVDSLWQRILQVYFPYEDNFLHEREEYASLDSRSRANVTLGVIHNNSRKKAIIIECKKTPSNNSGFAPPGTWNRAQSQLQEFLLRTGDAHGCLPSKVFGIVAIGIYVRFFELNNDSRHLESFEKNSRSFRIDTEAVEIERQIRGMKRIVQELREL